METLIIRPPFFKWAYRLMTIDGIGLRLDQSAVQLDAMITLKMTLELDYKSKSTANQLQIPISVDIYFVTKLTISRP